MDDFGIIEYFGRNELFRIILGFFILIVLVPLAILISFRMMLAAFGQTRTRILLVVVPLVIILVSAFIFDSVRTFLIVTLTVELFFFIVLLLGISGMLGAGQLTVDDEE